MKGKLEGRKSERLICKILTKGSCINGDFIGIMKNLSFDGLYIEADYLPKLPEIVNLNFQLPEIGSFDVKTKIVWQTEEEPELNRSACFGAQLIDLDIDSQEKIFDYIRKNKGTVLVLDTNKENRDYLKKTIEKGGYRVVTSTSKEDTLKKIKKRLPDLIMINTDLPDKDGYQFCRQLKLMDKNISEIPVILISDSPMDEMYKIKAFSCGGNDFITRPFNVFEVLARLESQIDLSHLIKQRNYLVSDIQNKNEDMESIQRQLLKSGKLAVFGKFMESISKQLRQYAKVVFDDLVNIKDSINNDTEVETQCETASTKIGLVLSNLTTLKELISNILNFSSSWPNEFSICDINKILSKIDSIVSYELESDSIEFYMKKIDTALQFKGNPNLIEYLVYNLIMNAKDSIITKGNSDGFIKVKCYLNDSENICIEIEDNGDGIKAKHKKHIFEPFFTTKESNHTGLGLTLSKEISEHHNGSIKIIKTSKDGTKISFCIPHFTVKQTNKSK